MHICFIGDSHLACVKKAWDAEFAGRHRDVKATFVASPGKTIGRLEARDGALSSAYEYARKALVFTTGGLDRIDGSYDAYALHGMRLGLAGTLEALRAAGGKPNADFVASERCRGVLRDAIENSIAMATLRKLRRITNAPAVVSSTPLASTQVVRWRERLVANRAAAPLAALLDEEYAFACRKLDAVFVPQPPETLARDGLGTKPEYSLDPARFRKEVEEAESQDRTHMNARYGAALAAA